MHEFGIAQSIVEAVMVESSRLKLGNRVTKVGLKIGDLSGVDVEALRFSFEAIVSGGELSSLGLDVEQLPHRRSCRGCEKEFEVDVNDFDASCPGCGDVHSEFLSGDELEIAYLEVDDE
jgi:hydrogenase nickel incorporation protein HypA/HybF